MSEQTALLALGSERRSNVGYHSNFIFFYDIIITNSGIVCSVDIRKVVVLLKGHQGTGSILHFFKINYKFMYKLGEINKLPSSLDNYTFVKSALLATVISLPFYFVNAKNWGSVWLFCILVIGLPTFIIILLKNHNTNFLIYTNKITINWGIIIKRSKTIFIDSVQNVSQEKGLLLRIFGLAILRIWTASQSQIVIDKNGNSTKPDGLLILSKEDVGWLNEFISNKK